MKAAAYPTGDAFTLLRAEHAVTSLLAESDSVRRTVPLIVRAIAETLGWDVAAAWEADPARPGMLRRNGTWYAPAIAADAIADLHATDSMPIDHGLPGRVWQSGSPSWIVDVAVDPDFPRAE